MTDEARLGGVWRGGFTGPHEPCPRQYDAEQFLAWKNEGHDYEHCQLFDLRIAEPVCDCWRAEQALRDRLIAENERYRTALEAIADCTDLFHRWPEEQDELNRL